MMGLLVYKPHLENDPSTRISSIKLVELSVQELSGVPWEVALSRVRLVGALPSEELVRKRPASTCSASDAKKLKENMAKTFGDLVAAQKPQDTRTLGSSAVWWQQASQVV